jgi:hypothetical protein
LCPVLLLLLLLSPSSHQAILYQLRLETISTSPQVEPAATRLTATQISMADTIM